MRWQLLASREPCIAVVGTRKPTEKGRGRTRAIVKRLVADDWTIVSGIAKGIDTEAHRTALHHGGRTIGVLGTPLTHASPAENAALQAEIAERFLLVSQVPVLRYLERPADRRKFFPERNVTMSALTDATIIVEAGDTSGTVHLARAALQQGRKLFIPDSCFRNPALRWPHQ